MAPLPNPLPHRALYAAFDRVPSPKGASTHVEKFAGCLFDSFGGGFLHVLGDSSLPSYQREESVEAVRFEPVDGNQLARALAYGTSLSSVLGGLDGTLEICHFRDPWSGVPILDREHHYATVFEVNGLPSIELPGIYPRLSPSTIAKIRNAERFCWENSDAIVVPSHGIAEALIRLGAPGNRIEVIPNGADPSHARPERPQQAPPRYLLYFGALQKWQGMDVLLQAFARLADIPDLHLVVCSSSHHRMGKPYLRLAERLGIVDRLVWMEGLGRSELVRWVAHASASLAPLTECARNVEQGCCPLKILESMALGTPVVASDLPAVREIATDREARLVHPDRPVELARALRVLLEYPEASRAMGERGKERLERYFTWEGSLLKLRDLYRRVLGNNQIGDL